jgi:hypothetical protein
MSEKLCKRVISGSKQEEITMRDVMGGLEEIATMLTYDPWPGDFEIIAIYPSSKEEEFGQTEESVVISKKKTQTTRRQADIISYKQGKLRLSKLA